MSEYAVIATGCDDRTIALIELTDSEAATVRRVAEAVTTASTYCCEPRLSIRTPDDDDRETVARGERKRAERDLEVKR